MAPNGEQPIFQLKAASWMILRVPERTATSCRPSLDTWPPMPPRLLHRKHSTTDHAKVGGLLQRTKAFTTVRRHVWLASALTDGGRHGSCFPSLRNEAYLHSGPSKLRRCIPV